MRVLDLDLVSFVTDLISCTGLPGSTWAWLEGTFDSCVRLTLPRPQSSFKRPKHPPRGVCLVLCLASGLMSLHFITASLRALANFFDANLVALNSGVEKKKQNQEYNKL